LEIRDRKQRKKIQDLAEISRFPLVSVVLVCHSSLLITPQVGIVFNYFSSSLKKIRYLFVQKCKKLVILKRIFATTSNKARVTIFVLSFKGSQDWSTDHKNINWRARLKYTLIRRQQARNVCYSDLLARKKNLLANIVYKRDSKICPFLANLFFF